MATLQEDIYVQADWIIRAFASDNQVLDYSVNSLIEVDRFFNQHSSNGQPTKEGRLAMNLGGVLFAIGSYVGQTIVKNVTGASWETDDNDPEGELTAAVKLPDGTRIWPIQKVIKRLQNGMEDAIYTYGHILTQDYTKQPFNQQFWTLTVENKPAKPWWKFW